jgi:hypothetical protein
LGVTNSFYEIYEQYPCRYFDIKRHFDNGLIVVNAHILEIHGQCFMVIIGQFAMICLFFETGFRKWPHRRTHVCRFAPRSLGAGAIRPPDNPRNTPGTLYPETPFKERPQKIDRLSKVI